ncbi:MAG: family 43 glycosylhydrolase [bacterium]|nr:family 43 glycosylhydrolase [bacterium]
MKRLTLVSLLVSMLIAAAPAAANECAFENPLIQFGQDPSVIYVDGMYYLVQSTAGTLVLHAADTLTGLGRTQPVPIFTPPPAQPYSYDLWAPELYYHEPTGEWFVYIAATSSPGLNATHRMYAIQADSDDPLGSWSFRGKVYDPANDFWAIDGAVFTWDDQLYMVWSGWETTQGDFPQNLYIAPMSDPLTISGERVLISEPDQPWEMSVAQLQEGPQPFIYEDTLSIVYSADASWSAAYSLGLLHLTGDDPLDPAAWTKIGPIFDRYDGEAGSVYGPGHNASPVPSPDGRESWLVYHAIASEFGGWAERGIHAQPFTWNPDGTPYFGDPIPDEIPVDLPSGEPCGLIAFTPPASSPQAESAQAATSTAPQATYTLDGIPLELGTGLLNTANSYSAAVWVALDSLDAPMAILSQEGGLNSSFALEYVDGAFAFSQFAQMGMGVTRVSADVVPQAGEWVHLAAVYSLVDEEMRLYVNGELAGTAANPDAWDSRLTTLLGGVRQRGQRVNPLVGRVHDVRLYAGALDADEIAGLYRENPPG